MRKPWTFRAVCVGFVVILALGMFALGISIWKDRADTIESGVRDARNVARVLGGQVERTIQSVDIVLRGLQRQFDGLDIETPNGLLDTRYAVPLRQRLMEQLQLLPQAFQLAVVSSNGRLLLSTAAWPTPTIDVSDREYFVDLQANDDDRLSISLPFSNRVSSEPTIVMARRLNGAQGRFLGIVFVSVRRAYFEAAYAAVDALRDQAFVLARPDGTVLVRFPGDGDRVGQRIPADSPFHAAVQRRGGAYRSPGVFDQVPRWFWAEGLQEYPLVAAVGVPERAILEQWRWRTIATVAGAVLFLICAVALLLIMARQYRDLSNSETALAGEHTKLAESEAELRANQSKLVDSEAALRVQIGRFDAALNHMSQGLAMFDREARLVVCNDRFRSFLRLSPDQGRPGLALRELISHCQHSCGFPADVDTFVAEIAAMVSAGLAHEVQDKDGRVFSIANNPTADGGWVVTFDDITARRVGEDKVRYLAHNDLLTGLANRPAFLEAIAQARLRLDATGMPFNVLMLDLDRFKQVNDVLGHAAGDALLKAVAERLKMSIRSIDVIGRLGGDEFAIIQTPPRRFERGDDAARIMRESAIALAARIIETIDAPFDIAGEKVFIGTSIGIALAPRDGTEPDALMSMADLALYRTKSQGRNDYSFFEREMAAQSEERQQLADELRAGLDRNEFEIHYQPAIDIRTRRPCTMEALVRWRHPSRGLIAADQFVTVAEDIGLVSALGEWVLQTACATAAGWPQDVRLAINLSPIQFRNTALFDVVVCALLDSGLAPERLEFEISERVLLEKDTETLSTLHQLKNLGLSIVLDNFGAGQTSLDYLKMFPFGKLKLDRTLTREVVDRSDSAAIACGVVNLARCLNIVTAAEGIESERQFEILRAAGLNQAQGFLFAHPRPASDLSFDPIAIDSVAAA